MSELSDTLRAAIDRADAVVAAFTESTRAMSKANAQLGIFHDTLVQAQREMSARPMSDDEMELAEEANAKAEMLGKLAMVHLNGATGRTK